MVGLRPADFWEMRPANYWPILRAVNRDKAERCKWEADLIRSLAATVVNLLSKRKVRKLKELWRYPWDDDEPKFDINKISQKDRAAQVAELMKKMNYGKREDKG